MVPAPGRAPARPKEPYLRALRAGLGFLRRDHLVAALILMLFFTNLFDAAYTSVLLPLWATEEGTSVVLGALFATFAVGAVLGNIVFTAVAPRAPRYALFTLGFLVGGAPRFVAVAFADTLGGLRGLVRRRSRRSPRSTRSSARSSTSGSPSG